jgi:uncharacterized protein (TIRG00374 family)
LNQTIKKSIKIAIPLLLAVFFGWYTFTKISIEDILPYFKSANYWWIILGIFLGLLSHLSRAYRWQFMLNPLGYSIKFPNSVMAVFIAYFANYGIPRSGELLRAAVATNYEKVPFEKSFGTIVAERIADLVVMAMIIAITLFFQFDFIYNLLLEKFNPSKIVIGVIGIVIAMTIFIVFVKRSRTNFAMKIKAFINGLIEGVMSIFKMERKWAFIFHTLFIWTMYVLMFYITSFSVAQLNNIPFIAIIIAFISASFTIAATNGGIFFYPLAVYAAFSLFGIDKDPSIAFGWIIWTSQTVMIIVFGIISFVLLPVYNRIK